MASLYTHHIPTTKLQRCLLGFSSAITAIRDPYRHDMVAVCSETTACHALEHMRKKMEKDKTGNRILIEKPTISSATVNLTILRGLPPNTFGRQYADMLSKYKITPDSRRRVKFVDDPDLAYVLQRYREVHDFNHLLLGQPTNLKGEVAVKWYEAIQTSLPMCWLAAIGGTLRLDGKRRRSLLENDLMWVIYDVALHSNFFMNIYYEERFTQDIDELREDMRIYFRKR